MTPAATVHRLQHATNAHDIDRLVDCFAVDYVNETPAHPGRGFTGREQVRRNWNQIFAAVPDITTDVIGCQESPDGIWSEWEMRGTRRDGAPHLMRGVIIFRVRNDLIASARFYLEPVDTGDLDATGAVRTLTGSS